MDLSYFAKAEPSANGNIFFKEFDIEGYNTLFSAFNSLNGLERSKYKGAEDYIVKNGGPSPSPEERNYKKYIEEMSENYNSGKFYNILPVDLYSEKDTIIDLLSSLETENYIKTVYKSKKLKMSGELQTDTAIKLTDCIRQGRSLLQSAYAANMLSKPLINFYAASAYAYATIVINSPVHKALNSLKGSHGHTYNHLKNAVEFGGKIPSGTFIDFLASIYMPQIVTEDVSFKYSALPSLDFVQSHEVSISLMALLSTVPELHDQTMQIPNVRNSVYPLKIKSTVEKETVVYLFEIGNGIEKPTNTSLKTIFKTDNVTEANGKYTISVPINKIRDIMPTIYQDTRGGLWYIDPLIEGFYLPEICLHYLIISALCNIMRYSPHEWNNILSNKISSEFSLLVSKYLRLFELKYPMLVVQQLTNFAPVIKP